MQTFVMPRAPQKRSKNFVVLRSIVFILIMSGTYLLVDFVLEHARRVTPVRVAHAVLFSSFLLLIQLWQWTRPQRYDTLTIDGDVMVFKGMASFRKLRRGTIRTVVETKRGLLRDGGMLISERTPFRMRMLGAFVWIPEETQGYQYLKSVVAEWMSPDASSSL